MHSLFIDQLGKCSFTLQRMLVEQRGSWVQEWNIYISYCPFHDKKAIYWSLIRSVEPIPMIYHDWYHWGSMVHLGRSVDESSIRHCSAEYHAHLELSSIQWIHDEWKGVSHPEYENLFPHVLSINDSHASFKVMHDVPIRPSRDQVHFLPYVVGLKNSKWKAYHPL